MTTETAFLKKFINDTNGIASREQGLQLAKSVADRGSLNPLAESLRAADNSLLILVAKQHGPEEMVLVCTPKDAPPWWTKQFKGDRTETGDLDVLTAPCTIHNASALRAALTNLVPAPLGLTPSFGFGDRIGLATPGHVDAMRLYGQGLAPIFAQQSIREMTRTERTSDQVMADATWGAFRAGWRGPVGADADHLRTTADVDETARAGFTFFTIDPSDYVDQQADNYTDAQVDEKFQEMLRDKVHGIVDLTGLYAGKSFDLGAAKVVFNETALKRAAVKYGRALSHICAMAEHTGKVMGQKGYELEISVDETDQPTTVLEHLFIALELKRNDVPVVSLAPRFIGHFEKGVDFRGDLDRFETDLVLHAAIASQYGPYKISLHSGSDKFGVYPQIGRDTNQAFHVKTAGTSYLEALRVACRTNPDLFVEIAAFSLGRFETDRATYHISAILEGTPGPAGLALDELERLYLDEDNGRQILHVTYGSVLTAREKGNQTSYRFRDRLQELLLDHRGLHDKLLARHLGKHLNLLRGRKE